MIICHQFGIERGRRQAVVALQGDHCRHGLGVRPGLDVGGLISAPLAHCGWSTRSSGADRLPGLSAVLEYDHPAPFGKELGGDALAGNDHWYTRYGVICSAQMRPTARAAARVSFAPKNASRSSVAGSSSSPRSRLEPGAHLVPAHVGEVRAFFRTMGDDALEGRPPCTAATYKSRPADASASNPAARWSGRRSCTVERRGPYCAGPRACPPAPPGHPPVPAQRCHERGQHCMRRRIVIGRHTRTRRDHDHPPHIPSYHRAAPRRQSGLTTAGVACSCHPGPVEGTISGR